MPGAGNLLTSVPARAITAEKRGLGSFLQDVLHFDCGSGFAGPDFELVGCLM